jgi:small subunit ribosomal protein S6
LAKPAPTYDLTLLLDLNATDAERAKIVADTKSTIEGSGRLLTDRDWGARPLAYEIRRREQAEYHLFQFEGPAALPGALARTLRITDGVLRHRIIKLEGSVPEPPSAPEPAVLAEAPSVPAPAAAPVEAAEAAPEPEPVETPPEPEAAAPPEVE